MGRPFFDSHGTQMKKANVEPCQNKKKALLFCACESVNENMAER